MARTTRVGQTERLQIDVPAIDKAELRQLMADTSTATITEVFQDMFAWYKRLVYDIKPEQRVQILNPDNTVDQVYKGTMIKHPRKAKEVALP